MRGACCAYDDGASTWLPDGIACGLILVKHRIWLCLRGKVMTFEASGRCMETSTRKNPSTLRMTDRLGFAHFMIDRREFQATRVP